MLHYIFDRIDRALHDTVVGLTYVVQHKVYAIMEVGDHTLQCGRLLLLHLIESTSCVSHGLKYRLYILE